MFVTCDYSLLEIIRANLKKKVLSHDCENKKLQFHSCLLLLIFRIRNSTMDYITESEDEEKQYLETQNLIDQGKEKKDVEEEKLCRVGWQVNNCFTV